VKQDSELLSIIAYDNKTEQFLTHFQQNLLQIYCRKLGNTNVNTKMGNCMKQTWVALAVATFIE
jgi:hypothetical protein